MVDCEPAFEAGHPDHEPGLPFVADGTKGISAHSVTTYLENNLEFRMWSCLRHLAENVKARLKAEGQ